MSHILSALWFLIGVLISAVPMLAFADEYPASTGWKYMSGKIKFSSAAEACASNDMTLVSCSSESTCTCKKEEGGTGTAKSGLYCPHGGVLSGNMCVDVEPCSEGQTRNPETGQCEPQCEAGRIYAEGLYPIPAGNVTTCAGSCAVHHTSVPSGDQHYWTSKFTGFTCQQGDECTESSPNFLGYVNDAPFCGSSGDPGDGGDTGGGDPGDGGDTGGGDPGDGGDTGGGDPGDGDGGGSTGGGGDGDGSGSGSGSGSGGGTGSGSGSGSGSGDGNGSGDGGGSGDGDGEGEGDGECEGDDCGPGAPSDIGDLYQKKEKTWGGVLADFRQKVVDAPFSQAALGFFSVSVSGGCPVWSSNVPMVGTITIDQFCSSTALTWLQIAGYALLALASFTAFRWAFL